MDEIGEVSPTLQVKLLRVLQERCFERVGGNETVRLDVRLLAATHRDLKDMVAKGRFREDLYYRLNVINLRVPPLRERVSDIPELVDYFLTCFEGEGDVPVTGLDERALSRLLDYRWPGNVRELQNAIQRAVILADDGTIKMEHLPPQVVARPVGLEPPIVPQATMLDFERYAILKTLEATGGSPRRAAAALGISVRKIQYRLQEWAADHAASPERESIATRRRIALRSPRGPRSAPNRGGR